MASDIVVLKVLQAIELGTTTSNWAKQSAARGETIAYFRCMRIREQTNEGNAFIAADKTNNFRQWKLNILCS